MPSWCKICYKAITLVSWTFSDRGIILEFKILRPAPNKKRTRPKIALCSKSCPPPLVVSAVVSANCINALNVFLLNIWRRPNVHQTFYQIPLQNIRHLIKIKQNYPAPMVFLRNKYTNPKIHPISDTRCVCICLRWLKQRTHHVILDSRKV